MNNEKNQLKAGVLLSYINIFLSNLIPIFYTPIMLNLLGQSEYGLYKLSSNITSYLSLVSLGISSAITRYLIKYKLEKSQEYEEKILGLFMIIFQVIAIVAFIIGLFLTLNLDIWYASSLTNSQLARMQIIVFIMVCNMSIGFALTPYISVVNAHEKFIFLQLMNILSTCVGPILNLIVLFLGYASIGMAVSSMIINVLVQLLYLIYVRNIIRIKPRYNNLPFELLREILGFSFWIFVSNIVSQLYNATDTVMIGAVPALATKGVAIYNVGTTFNSIMLTMTTALSNILAPKTNKMVFSGASQNELTDFVTKIGRLQSYIVTLIITGFISFGQPFIYFYAGVEYSDSYWVAILVMIPNVIPLIQSACLNVIIAQNKHKFRSIVYLGIAISNVIGTWILMKFLGVIGAALMTGLSLFIGTGVIMNWYYNKKTGLNMRKFWFEVGKIWIIPLLMSIFTLFISMVIDFYNLKVLLTGIFVFTIFYCFMQIKFVMNKNEKNLILKPIFNAINKLNYISFLKK